MRRLVIPARGGSKGIPKKNLQSVGGRSLVERAINVAKQSGVEQIVLSSDDEDILEIGRNLAISIFHRSPSTSGDDASTESVISEIVNEFADSWDANDQLGFIQPTSPFITPNSIIRCYEAARDGYSGFSAEVDHSFLWALQDSEWSPLNQPEFSRPRRQDLPQIVRETGGIYTFPLKRFQIQEYRFCAQAKPILVSTIEGIDIDTPEDLELARLIEPNFQDTKSIKLPAPRIIVTDFDGCLTNDMVVLSENNLESVSVNRKDGMAARIMRDLGIPLLILSSEMNPVVGLRAKKMGCEVIQGALDKATALRDFLTKNSISGNEVWYLGNEINDLEAMNLAGFSFCPSDASHKVMIRANQVLRTRGGDGVLMELIEYLAHEAK